MNRIDEHRKDALTRIEQREHQKCMKKRREEVQKNKDDKKRFFIIGKLVCQYFPDLMKCKLQHSDAEKEKEFSDLIKLLVYITDHPDILEAVKKLDVAGES